MVTVVLDVGGQNEPKRDSPFKFTFEKKNNFCRTLKRAYWKTVKYLFKSQDSVKTILAQFLVYPSLKTVGSNFNLNIVFILLVQKKTNVNIGFVFIRITDLQQDYKPQGNKSRGKTDLKLYYSAVQIVNRYSAPNCKPEKKSRKIIIIVIIIKCTMCYERRLH